MKLIYADSLDYVDPRYDFAADRSPADREPYWDDKFAHEFMDRAPYDGILVSRAIVGDHRLSGKYTESQSMRFRRVGARRFLRFSEEDFPGSSVFGDCGAFSYHKLEEPPYSAEDTVDFYGDGGFTHGCSVDHVIFDFEIMTPERETNLDVSDPRVRENKRRFEITLQNASEFISISRRLGTAFIPLGVVQGWSPQSMADAARQLVSMGYRYIAIGGMVPHKTPAIQAALGAIRDEIGYDIAIHILGFAKADEIHQFDKHKLTSFDTTSPLIRAFKDARNNYYLKGESGELLYYSAIRIPQAIENNALSRMVKAGRYKQEDLVSLERSALAAVRGYAKGDVDQEGALEDILAYSQVLLLATQKPGKVSVDREMALLRDRYRRTLADRPWERCGCAVCRDVGVEAIIFRASNRNKRRGIHNLSVYYDHLNLHREDRVNGKAVEF